MGVKILQLVVDERLRADFVEKLLRAAFLGHLLQVFAVFVHLVDVKRALVYVVGDVLFLDVRAFAKLAVKLLQPYVGLLRLAAGCRNLAHLLLYEHHGDGQEERKKDDEHQRTVDDLTLAVELMMVDLIYYRERLLHFVYAPERVAGRRVVHAARHVGVGAVDVALVVKHDRKQTQRRVLAYARTDVVDCREDETALGALGVALAGAGHGPIVVEKRASVGVVELIVSAGEQLYGLVEASVDVVLVGLDDDVVERTGGVDKQNGVAVAVGQLQIALLRLGVAAVVGHESVDIAVDMVVILYLVNVERALVNAVDIVQGLLVHTVDAAHLGEVHARVANV